jgi:hypothetical protein
VKGTPANVSSGAPRAAARRSPPLLSWPTRTMERQWQ